MLASRIVFAYDKAYYHDWINFIACDISILTLNEEEITIGKSMTACFKMRHKLYDALSDI